MQEENNSSQVNQGLKGKLPAEKTIGYVLLGVGLLMIVIPVFLMIGVLTGRSKPPQVLDAEAPSLQLPNLGDSIDLPQQLKAQGISINQQSPQATGQKIIPDEVFNFYVNAGIFYLLMLFIASAGSKVATIGVRLVKDVNVKS